MGDIERVTTTLEPRRGPLLNKIELSNKNYIYKPLT